MQKPKQGFLMLTPISLIHTDAIINTFNKTSLFYVSNFVKGMPFLSYFG